MAIMSRKSRYQFLIYIHRKNSLGQKCYIEENFCQFCESDIETTEHIFFNCIHSKLFWSHLNSYYNVANTHVNLLKQVRFGVFKKIVCNTT